MDQKLLSELKLSSEKIKTDSETLKNYSKDWTTYFDIKSSAVIFPTTTEDVVAVVSWAIKNQISLVPSGGRTGLSGGACAVNDEVIVCLEKMNQIVTFDPVGQIVTVQAGVITETLQKFALEKKLLYPVDFAARGSSQIGGNIATNAGGIKVVRYGLTRDWVVGLEVVTGTGEVLQLNNGLVKNATGYDLRHLFIGSEGTLGIITQAMIQLTAPPTAIKVLILSLTNMQSVMKVFAEFKNRTRLTAYEMFTEKALRQVLKSTGLARPLTTESEYYAVCEVEITSAQDEEKLLLIFAECVENGLLQDGAISQSEAQAKTFWRYREDISEALSTYSPYKNDIAVSISNVPNVMTELDQILKSSYPDWEVVWFGHIGDGNLHINILRPPRLSKDEFVRECRKVDQIIFKSIQNHQGSISAEHGVGLTKRSFLHYSRSSAEIELMRGIKKVFDPFGIMNPGKMI